MSERPFEWKRDGGGLCLFVVGAFVSVLMVKALASDGPLEEYTGTAAIAAQLAGTFGAIPCLVLAAGVGFLGARSFVTASETGALRHALGLVGCSVGLSILLGAFSHTAGGTFGLLTGGLMALETHPMLGALFGVLVLLASCWYAWLRQGAAGYEEQIRSAVEERAAVADPGVTAAEAAGLIPEDVPHLSVLARKSSYAIPLGVPASPYPEDVRLKGQVPAGARPIVNPNAPFPVASPLRPASEQPVEPFVEPYVEHVEPFHPGEDLAPAAPAVAAFDEPAAGEVQPLAEVGEPLATFEDELTERAEDRVPVDEAALESAPVRPAWERTGLGEDDEPVDAYGTPRSLIESLREAQQEMLAIPEVADLSAAAPQEIDEAVMAESEEFAAEPEPEEEEEIVEELVPASELEAPVAETHAPAQTTIFDFTGEEPAAVELFSEELPEPAPELAEAPVAELQPAAQEEGIELEIGEEPEMVLQPQAAPAERAHKSLSVDPERAKLLVQAGNLLVERGRVAVSMLQKEYKLDFDEACKVLDELQDIGLIGPYLGGQRRDILLTRDQWMEKAGAT